jgi:hypothetical protein
VKKATLIKQISPTQSIWSMYYRFPPPVTPRVFTVLQVTQLNETAPRTGYAVISHVTNCSTYTFYFKPSSLIISIPVDLSADAELAKMEEKGVHGRYVSVEQIKELENGKVEWRMATSSKAGGMIPQFTTELSMPTSISQVRFFIRNISLYMYAHSHFGG